MTKLTDLNPTEVIREWVFELKSGKHEQVKSRLKTSDGFCCLGVLCEVLKKNGVGDWVTKEDRNYFVTNDSGTSSHNFPSFDILEYLGLNKDIHTIRGTNDLPTELWQANDTHAKSFVEIAEIIEKEMI